MTERYEERHHGPSANDVEDEDLGTTTGAAVATTATVQSNPSSSSSTGTSSTTSETQRPTPEAFSLFLEKLKLQTDALFRTPEQQEEHDRMVNTRNRLLHAKQKNQQVCITANEDIVEHICRYVGPNQFRFMASICQQYHRVYTIMTFPNTNSSSSSTTGTGTGTGTGTANTNATDSSAITSSTTTKPTKKTTTTYYNLSTSTEHLTLCYNDTFCHTNDNNNNNRSDDDEEEEDYYEREQRLVQEDKVRTKFYQYIGKHATIEQFEYLYNTLDCPYSPQVATTAVSAGRRLTVIQFLNENYHQYRHHRLHNTSTGSCSNDTHQHCCRDGEDIVWDVHTCSMAFEKYRSDIVKYLHVHAECRCNKYTEGWYQAINGEDWELQWLSEDGEDFTLGLHDSIWDVVVQKGHILVIQYLVRNTFCPVNITKICKKAAMHGQLEIFRFAMNRMQAHGPVPSSWKSIAHHAAQGGNVAIIELVLEIYDGDATMCALAAFHGHFPALQYMHNNGVDWDELTCTLAAKSGHLHILQYAHNHGCPWDTKTCSWASENGHFHCLQYAHENNCPWDAATCWGAAKQGHLQCIQYARANGCAWDKLMCSLAAENDQLHVLQYAAKANDCPWDETTCYYAAKTGNLRILQFAHENGCPWDSSVCIEAAKLGNLKMLRYAHENGCPWTEAVCTEATKLGYLKMLKYAHGNGCPWDDTVCTEAANNNDMILLQYAHENGCPWSDSTAYYAAKNNNLTMLQYVLQNRCQFDEKTLEEAIKNGSLEMIEYAIKVGCPWNKSGTKCTLVAARHGQLKVLQYLIKLGCQLDRTSCVAAAHNGHLDVVQYLYSKGYRLGSNTYTGHENVDEWISK